jgi:hypothetical protein
MHGGLCRGIGRPELEEVALLKAPGKFRVDADADGPDNQTKHHKTDPDPTTGPGEQGGSVLGKLHFVGKPSSEDAVSTLAVGCGFDR